MDKLEKILAKVVAKRAGVKTKAGLREADKLIKMVTEMITGRDHFSELADKKPSVVNEIPWLYAKAKKQNAATTRSKRSGKWLIFSDSKLTDVLWGKIKHATEDGKLGPASKVATSYPHPFARDPNKRVICVYTSDWKNEKDVLRVRDHLRKLGISQKIPYKSDADTLAGKYRVTGSQKISKYFE